MGLVSWVSFSNKEHEGLSNVRWRCRYHRGVTYPDGIIILPACVFPSFPIFFFHKPAVGSGQERHADRHLIAHLLALRSGASGRFHLSTQEKSFDVENLSHPV